MQDELGEILENLTQVLSGLDSHLYTIAGVLGFFITGHGIWHLKNHAKGETGRALLSMGIGIMLFSMPSFVNSISLSLFEQEASLTSQLGGLSSHGILEPYIRFAITIVVLLGLASLIKGLLRLRSTALGNESGLWSGLTHILGGIVCMNIVTFARIFGASAGGIVNDVIQKLFS